MVEYAYDSWGRQLSCTGTLATSLGALNPFRYRGYVYDEETQWYYLKSRYYDPETCRFISADVLLSTGQGVLGHNCFAYCHNNPLIMSDSTGSIPNYNVSETDNGGGSLINQYIQGSYEKIVKDRSYANTTVAKDSLAINIREWDEQLYHAIDILGMNRVKTIMSQTARSKYQEVMGEKFVLSEETVAREIEFHIDGYMYSIGKKEYFFRRNVATCFFSVERLNNSCYLIEINANDRFAPPTKRGFYDALLFNYWGDFVNFGGSEE